MCMHRARLLKQPGRFIGGKAPCKCTSTSSALDDRSEDGHFRPDLRGHFEANPYNILTNLDRCFTASVVVLVARFEVLRIAEGFCYARGLVASATKMKS